uniref:ovochymase-2-like n=1 Tax=Styela clava TaxID=7725 RepID=UPI00193A7FD6|nr:ovochymase-2-like [Styela clava]
MMWKICKILRALILLEGIRHAVAFDCGRRPGFHSPPPEVGVSLIRTGEVPWLVEVYKSSDYICDGSVVGKRWILTSLQCIDVRDPLSDVHTEIRSSDEIHVFRVNRSLHNANSDAVILELTENIEFDEEIQPICVSRHEQQGIGGNCLLTMKTANSPSTFQIGISEAYQANCQTQYPEQNLNGIVCVNITEDCKENLPGQILYCKRDDDLFYVQGILSRPHNCAGLSLYENVLKSFEWIWKIINQDEMVMAARNAFVPTSRSGDPCSGDGVNLTSTSGIFSSPLYDGGNTTYPLSTKCFWKIFVPENHKILLQFDDFNVELFGLCAADWVKIYNGTDASKEHLISHVCGNFPPMPILSESNVITVEFNSDFVEADFGFLASFLAVHHSIEDSGCGSPRDVRTEIVISSRGYPTIFTTNPGDSCLWIIEAPEGKKILFDFMNFRMTVVGENELRIYDGTDTSTEHYHAFDEMRPPKNQVVITSSNHAVMELKVWNYMEWTAKGFHAQLKFISPNETENYPDAIDIGLTDYTGYCGEQEILPKFLTIGGRIVGGNESIPNSWPWQVNLRNNRKPITRIVCGGTLISYSWIITAAHCTPHPVLYAFAGDHLYIQTDYKMQIAKVLKKIVHDNYQVGATWNNDIALLELERPFRFTEYVRPACVPTPDVEFEVGTKCYATGWGKQQEGSNVVTPTLREAPIPLLSREKCGEIYFTEFTENMFCAGYLEGGIDACQGDSGGPLVCRQSGKFNWVLLGVTSWGWGCGRANYPGVYTRVNRYGEWIRNSTNNEARMNFNNSGPIPTMEPTTPAPTTVGTTTVEPITTTTAQPITTAQPVTTAPAPICEDFKLINGGEGTFTSLSHSNIGSEFINCTWSIQASHSAAVMEITFKEFDLPVLNLIGECGDDHITMKIIDTATNTTKITKKYCGTVKPPDVSAFSIDIFFIFNETEHYYPGFKVGYKEIDPCSGTSTFISEKSGVLFNPNYPEPYPTYMACSWTIVTHNMSIAIQFKVLSLAASDDGTCLDSILIKSEIGDDEDEMYGPYCAMHEPIVLSIVGNATILFESTSVGGVGNESGFFLEFEQYVPFVEFDVFQQASCFSLYFVDENGNFTGSKIKDDNVEEPICKWTIMGTNGHPISLVINPWIGVSNIDCTEHNIKLFYGSKNETICLDPPTPKTFLILDEEVLIDFVGEMVDERIGFDGSFVFVQGSAVSKYASSLYMITFLLILQIFYTDGS